MQPEAAVEAPISVTASFLFHVNPQALNEDPEAGGIPPRVDRTTGLWTPPEEAAGFGPQTQGAVYRWHNGVVTRASEVTSNAGLTPFRAVTMFYCNPFTQFVVTDGDASSRNMEGAAAPQDRWSPLGFHHLGSVSYLDFAGEHPYLAGNRAGFIRRIGLDSYQAREENAPRAGGLAGNLAMLIALIAFSCRSRDLDAVLVEDQAWDYLQWRGHDRRNGCQLNVNVMPMPLC